MKKLKLIFAVVSTLLILTGCQKAPAEAERPWPETVTYSNLNDETSRNIAENLLMDIAGEEEIQVFFDHVDQINQYLKPEELTDGFEEISISQPKYDPYELQALWEADHPEFLGYNCRITAYSFFRERMDIAPDASLDRPDYIMMDLLSLDSDSSAIPDEDSRNKFQALYTGIETDNTKDISVHLKNLQKSWNGRISFEQGPASLISVVFHDQIDGDKLFIGHTGILFESPEGLYFLEKVAFQEPYQLVKIADRAALSDYLMTKYDVEFDQPTAAPFVLENDELIEGFRSRDKA